jgi:acid phosphatase type 7
MPPPDDKRDRARAARAAAVGGVVVLALVGIAFAQVRSRARRPPASAATGFFKGPYLQGLGTRGVTLKLELATAAPALVLVRVAGSPAPVATVKSEITSSFHTIRVDGLTPATSYAYTVTSGASRQEGSFTTAPDDARPFRFLVYGDNRSDEAAHAAVVRAMMSARADFLVNTGDLVSRGTEPDDWQIFFDVEGPMLRDRCVFTAVGNHELYRGDRRGEVAFLQYFGGVEQSRPLTRLYGTFRWSSTRFFVLNAMDTWTGEERAWLRAELDRAMTEPGLAHRIAVLHWGPYSAGPHGGNPALASGDVIAMMRDRKVDLVLAGHDHDYERGTGGGLKYIVSGGGGAPLYKKKRVMRETRFFEAAHHFVSVAIDGDRVETVAHRATGGVLEACGFVGAGGWECDGGR